MRARVYLLLILSGLVVACATPEPVVDEQPAKVQQDPNVARTILEEPWVQVMRLDIPPNGSVPFGPGEQRAIYWITDAQLTNSDGALEHLRIGASSMFSDAQVLTNAGEDVASALVVIRRDGPLPAGQNEGQDVGELDLELSNVALDTDTFRAIRVTLPPQQTTSVHGGGARIVYALSSYTLGWEIGDGEQTTKDWKAGDVHSHEPGAHRATNVGESTADYVVIVVKP